MWLLIAVFGVMVLIALAFIWVPKSSQSAVDEAERARINIRIYEQRVSELENDFAEGVISEAEYQQLKQELDLGLLQDVPTEPQARHRAGRFPVRWVITLLVPIGAALLYYGILYKPEVPEWLALKKEMSSLIDRTLAQDPDVMEALQEHSVSEFLRSLQARLQRDADNAEGWSLLGNTYMQLKMPKQATEALQRAYRLNSDNAEYQLGYARALVSTNQGALTQDSYRIFRRLLQQNPNHPGALMSVGMAAFNAEQYRLAIDSWQTLLDIGQSRQSGSISQEDRERAESVLRRSINVAKQRLTAQQQTPEMEAGARELRITVNISPELAEQVQTGDTLFVLAKATSGPPLPLAVKRMPASGWPREVVLTEQDNMAPGLSIKEFDEIQLIARVSKSGQATAQAGDLEGRLSPIALQGGPVELAVTIDQELN